MGACYDEMDLDGKLSQSEVESRFKAYQDECSYESGNSYSGRLNMCRGLKFLYTECKSRNEAWQVIESQIEKWGPAIAIRYLEPNRINRQNPVLVKSLDKIDSAVHALRDFENSLVTKIEHKLKSCEFIKCSTCRSKLETRFRTKTLKCPVCNGSFATKSEIRQLEKLKAKLKAAEDRVSAKIQKLQDDVNKKPRKVRWLIVGLCSS